MIEHYERRKYILEDSDHGDSTSRRLLSLVLCGALPVTLDAEAIVQPAKRDLYLEVFVNGQSVNLITRFTDRGNGVFSADAGELRNSGVLPDSVATRGEVRLDQFPGLGWRLIEPEQTIRFIVPDGMLAPHVLDAELDGRAPPTEEPNPSSAVDHGYGLVLNYGVTLDGWQTEGGATDYNVGASFDGRMFMLLGALTHGFAMIEGEHDALNYRRLDTYWRSSFPGRALQVQLATAPRVAPAAPLHGGQERGACIL